MHTMKVSMGLTVNRQTVKEVTVNRQITVKGLEYRLSRTIIASNMVELFPRFSFILISTGVGNSSDFRLETLPVSKNISYLLILL